MGQGQSQMKKCHISPKLCLYSTKTYLKDQGYLKIKVKFPQYQGQTEEN